VQLVTTDSVTLFTGDAMEQCRDVGSIIEPPCLPFKWSHDVSHNKLNITTEVWKTEFGSPERVQKLCF
jgi:hypothetical protein